jgi:putative phosphoesterase
MFRVGLVSDTHGLLRPEVAEFLRGSHHIIHAGDICDSAILEQLSALAPVTAVRGKNDRGAWAENLAESDLIQLEDVFLYVIHDLAEIDIDPAGAGINVVVSGHSHKPHIERRGTVLYVNPGSPGPRRFKLPIAAAELLVEQGTVTARITEFAAQNAA